MSKWRTMQLVISLTVDDEADDDEVSQAVFEHLAEWPDPPFVSCDGWDPHRG